MNEVAIDLTRYTFFEGLDEKCLQELSKTANQKTFDDGELVIRKGNSADKFFIILEGKVNIITEKLESQEMSEPAPTTMQTLEKGEALGWSWLVPPHQWRFDAKAVEKTQILALDARGFREQCEQNPRFGYEVLKRLTKIMSDRLFATLYQLSMHSGAPSNQVEGG